MLKLIFLPYHALEFLFEGLFLSLSLSLSLTFTVFAGVKDANVDLVSCLRWNGDRPRTTKF